MPVARVPLGPKHGEVVVRHTEMVWGLNTILFIHGLGDSRQCFMEAFESEDLLNFNLLIPDLPGSGNSPGGEDLSISGMLSCLEEILDHYGVSDYIVVGHGLGADLGVWLAQRNRGRKGCRGVVAVEGTIGEQNLQYADMAIAAADDPSRTFIKWFQKYFIEDTVLHPNMGKGDVWRRYYEALNMCKPSAFLALSREMRDKLYTPAGEIQAFRAFRDLEIPKYFCYAERGRCDDFLAEMILNEAEVPHLRFSDCGHWLMSQQSSAFYRFLADFARKHMPQPTSSQRVANWFAGRWRAWVDHLPKPITGLWAKWKDLIRHIWRTKVYLRGGRIWPKK